MSDIRDVLINYVFGDSTQQLFHPQTCSQEVVIDSETDERLKTRLASMMEQLGRLGESMVYKGTVPTYYELPEEAEYGDTYKCEHGNGEDVNAGDVFVWNGEAWQKLSGDYDFTDMEQQITIAVNTAYSAVETAEAAVKEVSYEVPILTVTKGNGDTEEYTINADASTIRGDVDALKEEVDDLKGWVGYQDEDVYGVECDMTNCVFTRLAGAVGKEAGADFDSINAFGGRRRCNLTDGGVVTAYYGDSAYTTSGALTTAVTVEGTIYPVGTNVQVMVEQPVFYYKVVPLVLDGQSLKKVRYYVSDKAVNGFKLHPAFIENGHLNDKIYLSAYEGCLQSGGSYIKDDSAASSLTSAKLSSISKVQPVTGNKQQYTRSAARRTAENRGTGWELPYMATCAASQLLMVIEYASFNMQGAIGWGIASADEKVDVGGSDSLGNASGTVDIDGTNCYVSYRGEENLWGNVCSWLDGANTNNPSSWTNTTPPAVNTGTLYIADNNFKGSTSASPYEDSGIHPVWAYPAYVSAFGYDAVHDWLFVPTECKGNSFLPVGSAWWNAYSDWRPWTCFGGRWYLGSGCGAFTYWVDATSTSAHEYVGARIVYIPSKNANIKNEYITSQFEQIKE